MASSLHSAWPARFTQDGHRGANPAPQRERLGSVGAPGMSVAGSQVGSWPERGRWWWGWRGPGHTVPRWQGLGSQCWLQERGHRGCGRAAEAGA